MVTVRKESTRTELSYSMYNRHVIAFFSASLNVSSMRIVHSQQVKYVIPPLTDQALGHIRK
jgi:hypothetical protein